MLGTGASLAGLSVGSHTTGLAPAMSGPHSVESSDLDGLNISQVRQMCCILLYARYCAARL